MHKNAEIVRRVVGGERVGRRERTVLSDWRMRRKP